MVVETVRQQFAQNITNAMVDGELPQSSQLSRMEFPALVITLTYLKPINLDKININLNPDPLLCTAGATTFIAALLLIRNYVINNAKKGGYWKDDGKK